MLQVFINVQIASGAAIIPGVPFKKDALHEWGQWGMRPFTILTSNNTVLGDHFIDAPQHISVAKKVAVVFIALLLLPFTLLAMALGACLLSCSKSHRLYTLPTRLGEEINKAADGRQLRQAIKSIIEAANCFPLNGQTLYQRIERVLKCEEAVIIADIDRKIKEYVAVAKPFIQSLYGDRYEEVYRGIEQWADGMNQALAGKLEGAMATVIATIKRQEAWVASMTA